MTRFVLTPLLLSALVVLGCSGAGGPVGDDGVTLVASPDPAASGSALTLTLRNGTAATVGYNLCTSELMRVTEGGRETVPEDRFCTMELRTLQPGAQDSFQLTLPAIPPGEYLYVTGIYPMVDGDREEVESQRFRVGG
jgi:hypothetical protein